MVNAKRFADRSLKVFLCLVVLFGFLFVQPREKIQQVDAALPLLAWVAPVVGNILIDTALDMGLEFVDEAAKNKWKDKKVTELWNKYGEKIKDLVPTKKNLKEWSFEVPKWLMVAIVDMITDSVEDTIQMDSQRKKVNSDDDGDGYVLKPTFLTDDEDEPFYGTDVYIKEVVLHPDVIGGPDDSSSRKMFAFMSEWVSYSLQPNSYSRTSRLTAVSGDEVLFSADLPAGEYSLQVYQNADSTYGRVFVKRLSDGSSFDTFTVTSDKHYQAFKKYLQLLEEKAKKVYSDDGVLVSDYDSYFDLPDDDDDGNTIVYSPDVLEKIDDTKYPMVKPKRFDFEFGGDSTDVDSDYELIDDGESLSWEIIEKDITNNTDNYNKVINYDYEPTINNYYEIADKEELEKDISIIVKNDIDVGGGGNGGSWSGEIEIEGPFYCVDKQSKLPTSCKEVEAIDGSLLDYVSNAYDYAVNAVKSGADGLAIIASGATGLLVLYGNIFGWLPSEMTVILTSGLLLMIGLRVFRK